MNPHYSLFALLFAAVIGIASCQQETPTIPPANDTISADTTRTIADGYLFIIGGGSRPDSMIREMIQLSALREGGYGLVLPMASSIPDTAAYYGIQQFKDQGIENIVELRYYKDSIDRKSLVDSIRTASLIYLTGGSQLSLMDALHESPAFDALRDAWIRGAVIAGTSAGAAVMSRQMITGDQKKHPVYTGDFPSIEDKNIILQPGLGLLPEHIIIDQHFIQRQRLNRLITVVIENPNFTGIGIDESTAIIVHDNKARVCGESQVIVLKNPELSKVVCNGLLGAKGLKMDILLPGDEFQLQ